MLPGKYLYIGAYDCPGLIKAFKCTTPLMISVSLRGYLTGTIAGPVILAVTETKSSA